MLISWYCPVHAPRYELGPRGARGALDRRHCYASPNHYANSYPNGPSVFFSTFCLGGLPHLASRITTMHVTKAILCQQGANAPRQDKGGFMRDQESARRAYPKAYTTGAITVRLGSRHVRLITVRFQRFRGSGAATGRRPTSGKAA